MVLIAFILLGIIGLILFDRQDDRIKALKRELVNSNRELKERIEKLERSGGNSTASSDAAPAVEQPRRPTAAVSPAPWEKTHPTEALHAAAVSGTEKSRRDEFAFTRPRFASQFWRQMEF